MAELNHLLAIDFGEEPKNFIFSEMNILQQIKIKSVLFYGLGRENVSLIKYLTKNNLLQKIYYYDEKEFSGALLLPSEKITKEKISDFQIIFKTAGVSLYSAEIQEAVKNGAEIYSPNQLFFELNSAKKICISGSKGKSTFCKLLADLLEIIGLKVIKAGNIGFALSDYIDEKPDYFVIELSSYQLASLKIKPDIAVVTSLFPEHLSWHRTIEKYYQDKLNLLNQTNSVFLADPAAKEKILANNPKIQILSADNLINEFDLSKSYFLPEHLSRTLNLALSISRQISDSRDINFNQYHQQIQNLISDFKSLPHRLEIIYQDKNLTIINDSIATAPEATVAALKSFAGKNIILIVGGAEKGTTQEVLINYLKETPIYKIICLPDTGNEIYQALNDSYKNIVLVDSLKEAVDKSFQDLPENAVLLLSPAATSFNQFRDFEERGEIFKDLVLSSGYIKNQEI